LLNVGLELSRSLLELSERDRRLQTAKRFENLVRSAASARAPVLLDNTEILFARELSLLPLEALQGVAHGRKVVASWSGTVSGGRIMYAEPGHPEYRSYLATELVVVEP